MKWITLCLIWALFWLEGVYAQNTLTPTPHPNPAASTPNATASKTVKETTIWFTAKELLDKRDYLLYVYILKGMSGHEAYRRISKYTTFKDAMIAMQDFMSGHMDEYYVAEIKNEITNTRGRVGRWGFVLKRREGLPPPPLKQAPKKPAGPTPSATTVTP